MASKTCVITGASRGIGLATALRFAREGHWIVAAARNDEDLEKTVEQVSEAGSECLAVTADLARPEDVHELIRAATARFGRVDVLVNNAGCAPLVAIDEMTTEDFERVQTLNIGGVFHATQAVWPVMKEQGGGVIVNISSVAAVDPFRGFAVYGASKAWVNTFTRATADEGKSHGIRVFAVAPGAVETRMLRSAFPDLPADATLAPDDVAGVIASLCDDRMAACSGQTIFVRK